MSKFYNLSFFKSSDLCFWSKKVFLLQFLVDILPLGSGSRKPKSCGSNGALPIPSWYQLSFKNVPSPKICMNTLNKILQPKRVRGSL